MKKILLMGAIGLSVFAWAQAIPKDLSVLSKEDLKKFRVENDKFSGQTTIRPDFTYSDPTIRIKLVISDNMMFLYLISSYQGSDWIFMKNATLLIDGQKYEYTLSNESQNVRTGYVTEYSTDYVKKDMMKIVEAIADSKEIIEVRFSGSKGVKDFKLPEKTRDRFAGMLNIYNKLKK